MNLLENTKKIWKPSFLALAYASVLTFLSLLVSALNISLDEDTVIFILAFQELSIDLTTPVITAILWYEGLFFILFLLAFTVQSRLREMGKNISIWILVIPVLVLIVIRSIIVEPYLYQTFYSALSWFRIMMDALLYFDIKWIIEAILLLIATITTIILLKKYAFVALGIILVIVIPRPYSYTDTSPNGETIIILVTDSLRKDATEQEDLFVHKIFEDSTVIENMYTVFPASVPTLASIFSGDYPYKSRATAISLDKQLDLSLVHELSKQYRLSAHVDYSDDDLINRSNFNIPFDEVHYPVIDTQSTVYANALTKQVILMALLGDIRLRNIFLPQIYRSDSNANTKVTLDAALAYLTKERTQKKIDFISIGETHIPYKATYPYYREYLNKTETPQFKWFFDYKDYSYNGESIEKNQNVRNLYQMSVKRFDHHFKYFMERLEKNNLLESTTLVILADQGENLFDNDLDLYSHNNLDTVHVLNVPFAIYQKGLPPKVVTEGNYQLTDTFNLALHPNNLTNYAKSDIYLEADLDVHDPSNPLYANNIGNILDVRDFNKIKIIDNDTLQRYKRRAVINGDNILTYHPIENPPYALYHIPTDPLFQSDQQKNQPEIFSALQLKLSEFIADTLRY